MDNPKPRTGPKDIFLHLLAIIALYLTATHVGVLGFQLINEWIADPLNTGCCDGAPFDYSLLRWALAVLLIVGPVYAGVRWYLERDVAKNPEKRALRTRRWLLSFTVFAAAIVIIGDLIAVLNRFLQGELTMRFALKIFLILIIAAAVFAFEFGVLRRDQKGLPFQWLRWLAGASGAVVIAGIIVGFVVLGSPQLERARRFDLQRLEHLQGIQWQIVNHWQSTETLPASISELRDDISGYIPPVDPETKTPYEYRVVGERQFELCATFRTSAIAQDAFTGRKPAPYSVNELGEYYTWPHEADRTCYARTIDPQLYPLKDSAKPIKSPRPLD
ncbi:MAG: DUF5671 domain-containing protein [Candidatus Uhrbacteria bacterium]